MKRHPNYDKIPDAAIVQSIHADGTIGNYGLVKGADLHYMLRGYEYNEEFDLWFRDNTEWAYSVKPVPYVYDL